MTVISMLDPMRPARRRFTFAHGVAASIALHGALCLPFVADAWPEDGEAALPLVFDLEGMLSDSETEEATAQDTKADAQPPTDVASPKEPTPEQTADGEIAQAAKQATNTPPQTTKKAEAGDRDVKGEEEDRKAQTSAKHEKQDDDPVNLYAKQLAKRIRRLGYAAKARAAGLHGSATVSFTIAASGQIVPSSLHVVAGSGHPQLDADALKTVRAASPFAPPPREMTVAVDVFSGGR